MPPRRSDRARVLGPTWIPAKQRYRVLVITPQADGTGSRRATRWFADPAEAQELAEQIAAKLGRLSVTTTSAAIDQYEAHLAESGTVAVSYRETCRRLRLFFDPLTLPVSRITPERAAAAYETFRKRLRPDGAPISVDYHRAALINARSFLNFCIAQEWLSLNPLAHVKGIGRRSSGKPQLTGDEVRTLYTHCLARAEEGEASSLGILMALLMALRSSDLTRRVVRDVDFEGTVLRVTSGKTRRSNRPRRIPAVLQPMVLKLIDGRVAEAPLFPTPYTATGHHTRRWLEEAMRKRCDEAGVPYVPPHSLKGIAGTVLAETGELADRIADHLSHESSKTSERHYIAPGALDDARLGRALKVITGGRA